MMTKKTRQLKISWLVISFLVVSFFTSCKKQFYLRGSFEQQEFIAQCRWKDPYASKYKPDLRYIDSLKAIQTPVDVKIAVGTWCNDSEKWVPRFFKISNHLPIQSLLLVAVDTSKKDSLGWTKAAKIDSLPTFIFYRSGKEIGRIVEKPQKRKLEKHLYKIIK